MARTKKQKYSFPTVSQCPRCRGTDTRARSTQGKVQYRICLAAVCRKRYAVIGTKIKIKKESTAGTAENAEKNKSQKVEGGKESTAGTAENAEK